MEECSFVCSFVRVVAGGIGCSIMELLPVESACRCCRWNRLVSSYGRVEVRLWNSEVHGWPCEWVESSRSIRVWLLSALELPLAAVVVAFVLLLSMTCGGLFVDVCSLSSWSGVKSFLLTLAFDVGFLYLCSRSLWLPLKPVVVLGSFSSLFAGASYIIVSGAELLYWCRMPFSPLNVGLTTPKLVSWYNLIFTQFKGENEGAFSAYLEL